MRKRELTEGQKHCLRLVAGHHTSKEIARILDISHFTVDQRLDGARRKLNVKTRKEAALLFAAIEANNLSERIVYETPHIADAGRSANGDVPTSDRGHAFGSGKIVMRSSLNGESRDKKSNLHSLFSIIGVPPIGGADINLVAGKFCCGR
ncbi:MAG: helix-turn-helix transcriptional regulator [Sphingorhabdus sp.]